MNNTITYKLNGKIYDVPDDKSKDFESQYKDATVAYKVGGKIYDIPVSKKSEFLSEYKDAEYYDDSRPTNIGQDQNTEPATPQQKRQGGFWNTWIGDAIEKLNAGGAMIGKNLFGALDKATQGVEKLGLGTRGGAFKNLSDYFKGVEETSRANSDRYNGKSYSDLWKEGDYAGAIGDIALQGAESLPMSIAAAASTIAGAPIAGLAGIGALTANEKYDQLDAEYPDMDEFAKVTNAILTGTAEGASEMLGAGVSKAWMKTLYKSLGKEKAEEAIKKGLMGQIQKHYKEFGMFYEPIEEGIEEVASQLAENITDKITGVDPDRDITDGLKDSFVYGMGGGAYFSAAGAPGFAKRQYEKLKTRKDLKNARENFRAVFADNEKILGLESELENSTPEEKAVFLTAVNESEQFSPEEKEAIGLLVDADVNYRSWRTPEAVEEEKAERKELAVQTEMINYDNSMAGIIASNGMIQQVYVNGDMQNPVAIIEGDVALTPKTDGTMAIDRRNSSEVLYYKDADGRTIPISPRNVTDVYNVVSAQDQRAQYEANLRTQIDMQEQARAQQRMQEEAFEIENEDSVSYIDPDTGKQVNGIVRDINPGSETMSIEIDGGKLATVPKEIVVKSTIQTVPVQESRDQSVDSPLGNETATDSKQNAEQPTIEAPVAETAKSPKNGIVTREDGTPDFIASGEESSLDFLAEKYGDKMRRKVEVTKKALNADLEKAQKALLKAEQDYDDAPIGKEDKAEQALRKAQETYDAVKKEADFWTGLNEIVTQEKPGDQIANDIKEMGDPLNGEELAARLLATGAIKLTRDSYRRETGAGNQESKKMFGLFASPEKGGVSIERAGELVMTEDLEAGTNFFDQDDPNAGRNAIIEVLSSARTRGDLINYIKNAREKRAEQEREAEYNEYAAWCEDNYHMSPEDYEAYEEDMRKQAQSVSDEAVEYVNGEIVDEIQSIKEEQEEIDAILAQNKNKQNEEIERNDQGRTGGLRERGDQLLQEEQPVQTGRVGEIEQKHAGIDGSVDLTDGVTQESASGEIDRQGNPIDSEGNLIIEDVNSVSDITDEDFTSPYRTIGLPSVPKNVSDAIGADGKRVIIKKNIFEKNSKAHAFTPQSSRDILERALYNPDIVGQSQPNTKKNHWVVIKLDDKSPIVVLEVNNNKDNVEIVGWYTLDNRNLDRIRRQAKREGGELLILTSKEAAASLSTLPSDLSSTDKDSESASNSKEKTQENETSFEMMNRIAAEQKAKHDISEAEQQVDVNPTEAQKEAGNYKKGHIQIDGFDISIEQPKESVRSGKDASGKEWSVTMNNTYGYIRGTEGVDGDHIDVFLSDSPASGRVYVVDQVKDDGSFDEHKVMYGFNSEEEAKAAYLSNYSPGWKGLGNITEVSKDDFKKWIDSSKRKTKPFADYKIANKTEDNGKLYKIHSVSDIKNLKTFVSDQLREKGIIEENNPEEYAEIYDDIVNSNQYAEYIGSIISNNDMQYLYDHMPVKTRKQDLIELKSNLSDAGIELEDIVDTRIKRTERKPDRPLESLSDEDNSVIGKTVTIKYFDGTFVKGVIEKLQNGKISVRSLKNGRLYTVNKSAIVEDGSSPDIRFRDSKRGNINVDEEIKSFANKHNLNEADVKKYAQSIKMGNLGGASYAFISIKRIVRLQNSNLSLGQFAEVFNPIKKELYENFGDVDALRDEYTQKEMEARNVMEAARKRAEEEAKAEKKRLEEADNGSNVDAEYFAAIERGDMEEAQRIVNEAADRAGYSVGSDYQGASAFNGAAPYGNGYFITKEERKEAWEDGEFEGESTLGDYIDNGVDGGNLEVLTNGESYRTADEKRKEAIENVRNVIEGKRRTITMYRSVPSSVKEGKFRNGDWVTPSRKYAMENAKIHGWDEGYRIIEQEVSVDEVWFDGNDIAEWGYGREEDFANDTDFAYKNTKNNRKLLDAITRDDKGNIIPPSNRFNARKADVRFRFIGEKGAANLDKSEEVTTRLDNLAVAREMETDGKDARKIKLATGWERGADGKWRYEAEDFEVDARGLARKNDLHERLPWGKELNVLSDKLLDGEALTETEKTRFDELTSLLDELRKTYQAADVRYLDDYVKGRELFDAYPELKKVRVEMYNDPKSQTGATWYGDQNLIRVNEASLGVSDLRNILLHEVQHAIQGIEGFARGGNESTYRNYLAGLKEKRDSWAVVEELEEKRKELDDNAKPIDVYNALIDEYRSLGLEFGDGFIPNRSTFDKGFNLWVRGYDNEGYEDAYNEYHKLVDKYGLGISRDNYRELAGEVEARNVESRMNMSPAERGKMLASETEDVSREDQIFLMDNTENNVRINSISESTNDIEEVNERFNNELRQQIDGTLPKGHIYKLGKPSKFLQAAGIPDLSIEMPASQLEYKATSGKHDYDLSEVMNLPEAISSPIATFSYGNKEKSQNILTMLEHNGENFLVGMFIRPTVKGRILEVNSVRNVFPKNNDSIVKWILDGKLTNVDKEKLLNFLDQQRTNYADVASVLPDEQVKQRNSEVSSATKVVESFVNPTLEEGKISSSVEELSESLNTPVHIIQDVNDITDTNKELQRQKRGSKGWYDTKTGEVYLVLPNAESVADAQATILHETVAHKGLRGLLGDNFGSTMDSVFDSLPQEVQSGLMDSYGDRVVAAEEYCAEMAETMTDPGIIQKICSAIKEALRKIGINLKISDGDIMYMLWKSKNRLENSDTAFDIMRKAKTDAMVKEQSREYDNLFRSKKPLSKLGLSDDLQRRIEGKMQSRTELFQEAYVDRMISVKKLQEEVEKAIGKKIPDYMNVYVYENTLSSRNTYEQEQFEQKRIKPLLSAIKDLRDKGYSEREIENYVLAKHGIERNEYMRYAVLEKAIDAIKDETLKQQLLAEIANKKFSDITQLSNKEMDELRESLGRRDFAGLTGTYADTKGAKDFQSFLKQMEADGKTIADFMPEIENFISDMEISNKIEISNLWDKIRAVNEYSLKKWFDTGMINRKTYDKIKGMYENYVPLRGFAEAQMSDVFDYFSDRDIVYNETVKTAKGRTSRPDNPFAYMASVGDSAIVGGNKNQMKLHLLRMAMDGATDMLTVNKQWYEVSHDANGNELWTPAYPVYDEDPEVYRKNIEDFEADMLLKKSQGLADTKRGRLTNDLDEKSQKNLDQHAVRVKLNGEEYVVYVNGNPKVAQAVNGLNTPEQTENKFLKGIAWMNREMAANFTTRNPAFILSNLSRDLIWASSTLGVKENGKYQRKFMRNVPKAMKALKKRIMEGEGWKPDPNDPVSVMLDEFLRNGGRTGYTALYNIDKYKNRIEDATKTGKKAEVKRKAEKVFDAMGVLNEWAEDISRFATFMTSRQMGRSLLQSTYDAKEVTVNFNRKGSGAKGNEWFRAFYIFFNAAVQSLNNAYNMAVKNPGKALALTGGYMTAGAVIPLLLQSLGDDDDKEKYMGLPDYVRKNNVCIPLSMFGMDGFLKIPLPIELRAFYGIGDSFIRYIQHYDEGTDALTDATMGLLDLLPLNPAGGASNFVPSYIQPIVESYVTNEDFTGKPIAKITPFNEYDPEYQKVYKSTGVVAVKLSEYLNALAGGDEAKRKFATFKTSSGADLLNPASVEHLFESYLGGAFTFANQSFKTFVGAPFRLNDFSSRNIPVLNRFYDTGEVDGTMIKVNEKFFKYVDDAKKAEATYRNYEKLIDNSPSLESAEYMKKLDEYEQSDEWKRAEFILDAKDEIGELNEEVKESTDENYVKFLKEEIASKKKEMVDALKGGKVPE